MIRAMLSLCKDYSIRSRQFVTNLRISPTPWMNDEFGCGVRHVQGHTIGVMVAEASVLSLTPQAFPDREFMREFENLRRESRCQPSVFAVSAGAEKKISECSPDLLQQLVELVEPFTLGDPESSLRWVSKSLRRLQGELERQGYSISHTQVGRLLKTLEYSLQALRRREEGGRHPDRDAQFVYIHQQIYTVALCGGPALSVDAKKKENIGNYANNGREYHKKGQAPSVNVYDFVDPHLGKVAPYGIYDIGRNDGFVNVGISADTAEFAVNSIRKWWHFIGRAAYPYAPAILITADGGGSNSARSRLWKVELQRFVNELALSIGVCHYPPGTSKWNKIEHRLFAPISQNWRGKPLTTRETVVNFIRHTTTEQGLQIHAQLDERVYQRGRKISDEELAEVNIERAGFHGEWNYTIHPNRSM